MARSPYSTLWERLMANIDEPENEQACWLWNGKHDRSWYGRLNVYVPGLAGRVTVSAHVAAFVCLWAQPQNADEFWLAYLEMRHSDLEVDHKCNDPRCINPDHHAPVTASENCKLRNARLKLGVFRLLRV